MNVNIARTGRIVRGVVIGLLAVALAALTAAALASCGGSGSQTVRGSILGGTANGVTVEEATGGASGLCSGAVPGGQVIVKGPSGTLLATTVLQGKLGQYQTGLMTFSTTIPSGSGPYTIDVTGVSSVVVPGSQLGNLHLTCS